MWWGGRRRGIGVILFYGKSRASRGEGCNAGLPCYPANTYIHPYLFSHSLIPNTHPRAGNVANQAGKVCAGIRPGAVGGRGGILNARR